MDHQDWKPVIIRKKKTKTGSKESNINASKLQGENVVTEKKYMAGSNKQRAQQDFRKIDNIDDTDDPLTFKTVDYSVSQLIQKARQEKGWTQKELGMKINEKAEVIRDYESGTAIPNEQVLRKLERLFNMRLRGKDAGKPISKPKK